MACGACTGCDGCKGCKNECKGCQSDCKSGCKENSNSNPKYRDEITPNTPVDIIQVTIVDAEGNQVDYVELKATHHPGTDQ